MVSINLETLKSFRTKINRGDRAPQRRDGFGAEFVLLLIEAREDIIP